MLKRVFLLALLGFGSINAMEPDFSLNNDGLHQPIPVKGTLLRLLPKELLGQLCCFLALLNNKYISRHLAMGYLHKVIDLDKQNEKNVDEDNLALCVIHGRCLLINFESVMKMIKIYLAESPNWIAKQNAVEMANKALCAYEIQRLAKFLWETNNGRNLAKRLSGYTIMNLLEVLELSRKTYESLETFDKEEMIFPLWADITNILKDFKLELAASLYSKEIEKEFDKFLENEIQKTNNEKNLNVDESIRNRQLILFNLLCHACVTDNINLVKFLIQKGLEFSSKIGKYCTIRSWIKFQAKFYQNLETSLISRRLFPLKLSICNPEIVRCLLQANAYPNETDRINNSCLMLATMMKQLDTVRALLEARGKIDVNKDNELTGNTALMIAVQNADVYTFKLLLSAGADTTIRNVMGQTALDIAKRMKADHYSAYNCSYDFGLPLRLDVIIELLSKNAEQR